MTDIERIDPPLRADETTTTRAFLDYHRDTLRSKVAGLDHAGLSTPLAPASMTLGGMLKHLAYVEHHWFNRVLMGGPAVEPWASVDWEADPDWEWHSALDPGAPDGRVRPPQRPRGPDPGVHRRGDGRLTTSKAPSRTIIRACCAPRRGIR